MPPRRSPKQSPVAPPLPLAPEDEASATSAELQRESAWQRDGEWIWNDQPLQPWSRERESLFTRLIENDEGNRSLDDLALMQARLDALVKKDKQAKAYQVRDIADPMLFIEQASLLLYLASHQPESWDHLRGRPAAFLRAATAWAETAIAPGSEWDAILLAAQIRTAHRALIAIRRPSPGGNRSGEGN